MPGAFDAFTHRTPVHVLIVEDNERITRFLRQGLEEEGCRITAEADGPPGLQRLLDDPPDTCVLDVMLPTMSGFDVLAQAREAGCETPVLLLTARGAIDDRVRGLDLGADDYLAKPFEFRELLARLRALHRRAQRGSGGELRIADVVIDLRTRKARRGDRALHLSPREFSLLQSLTEHRDAVLSRSQILRDVFDLDFDPSTNIVDVYVGYLRRKLGTPGLIRTVRGEGYTIGDPS